MASDRKSSETTPPEGGSEELKSHILALVQLLAIRITGGATSRLKRELGIGSTNFRTLSVLAVEPGASGARIAEVLGRDEAAVSRSLKPLIECGLIVVDSGSGRARRLRLTDEGRSVQARGWELARARERRLVSVLSVDEQEQLRGSLQRLLSQAEREAER